VALEQLLVQTEPMELPSLVPELVVVVHLLVIAVALVVAVL
jgi:hypothetical protein